VIKLENSCNDTKIVDRNKFKFPSNFTNLGRPWMRDDVLVTLYSSKTLDKNWRTIGRQKVQGLENNETVADVIAYLRSNGCLFVAFGSVVRDAMLGEKARNVDGVISCEMKKVQSLCLAKYGRKNCGLASGMMDNTEVVIGNFQSLSDRASLPLHLSEWNELFAGNPMRWEYTANTLGYFFNDEDASGAVLDIDKPAIGDICTRKIAIPVEEADRDKWAQNNFIKLMRYWKLRARGFTADNEETHRYVVSSTKRLMTADGLRLFYCTEVVHGQYHESHDRREPYCESTDIDGYSMSPVDETLKTDFGANFYMQTIGPAIQEMRMQFETSRAVDTAIARGILIAVLSICCAFSMMISY